MTREDRVRLLLILSWTLEPAPKGVGDGGGKSSEPLGPVLGAVIARDVLGSFYELDRALKRIPPDQRRAVQDVYVQQSAKPHSLETRTTAEEGVTELTALMPYPIRIPFDYQGPEGNRLVYEWQKGCIPDKKKATALARLARAVVAHRSPGVR